eukprot:gene6651-2502_t
MTVAFRAGRPLAATSTAAADQTQTHIETDESRAIEAVGTAPSQLLAEEAAKFPIAAAIIDLTNKEAHDAVPTVYTLSIAMAANRRSEIPGGKSEVNGAASAATAAALSLPIETVKGQISQSSRRQWLTAAHKAKEAVRMHLAAANEP